MYQFDWKRVNFIKIFVTIPFKGELFFASPFRMISYAFRPKKHFIYIENRFSHWTLMTQFNNQFRSEFGRQNESFSCIVDSIRNKETNKKWTAYSISWERFKSLSRFMLKSMRWVWKGTEEKKEKGRRERRKSKEFEMNKFKRRLLWTNKHTYICRCNKAD